MIKPGRAAANFSIRVGGASVRAMSKGARVHGAPCPDEQDEDGVYVAEVPAPPGCISQGQTREEAAVEVERLSA